MHDHRNQCLLSGHRKECSRYPETCQAMQKLASLGMRIYVTCEPRDKIRLARNGWTCQHVFSCTSQYRQELTTGHYPSRTDKEWSAGIDNRTSEIYQSGSQIQCQVLDLRMYWLIGKIKEMLHKLSFKISSKPIKNPYVKDTGEKYCKITPCELTGGKFIIHILHILL